MKNKSKLFIRKKKIGISLLIFVLILIFNFSSKQDVFAQTNSPKLANYYLNWDLSETQAKDLSKWDLLVLDMEVQARHPDLLQKMRLWNPDIILLVYITPQEIITNVDCLNFANDLNDGFNWMMKQLANLSVSSQIRSKIQQMKNGGNVELTNILALLSDGKTNEALNSFAIFLKDLMFVIINKHG